jgi:two-component system NtrC family sensor kinase
LQVYDGERFRAVAVRGLPEAFGDLLREGFLPDPKHPQSGILRGKRFVQIPDMAIVPGSEAAVKLGGMRTALGVPLRKDGALLGQIVAARPEVRPFSEKEIVLLENFAAQAVIAMENARLITETREALDQQTATAEVLGIINSSPGDLAPVFDAMLEKATRLCEAPFGILRTWDGERFHFGAVHGDPQACVWVRQLAPVRPDRDDSLLGRIEKGERVVRVADARSDEGLRTSAGFREMVEASGIRSAITLALHKDDALLGIITVYRQEVRPFSDKQIALLQNFAAQAVIAMENARLITETREALEQQTATAEVLQVINASPGDLAPVFDAMLEKATRFCEGTQGILWTYDGERFRPVAMYGVAAELAAFLKQGVGPGPRAPIMRILRGERLVEIIDLKADQSYQAGEPLPRAAVEIGGFRSIIFVALVKDETLLGAFAIARQEVRAFTEKQIALAENFAAQAVIAMENARLLDEIRQRQAELRTTFDNMEWRRDVRR